MQNDQTQKPLKEHNGLLWIDDNPGPDTPGQQFSLQATDVEDALVQAKAKYGEHTMIVWGDEFVQRWKFKEENSNAYRAILQARREAARMQGGPTPEQLHDYLLTVRLDGNSKDGNPWTKFLLKAFAMDDDEAYALAKAKYEGLPFSIWREDDPTYKPFKEYIGIVWFDGMYFDGIPRIEKPGLRTLSLARDVNEAATLVEAKYGDLPSSIWNEDDRHRIR